MSCFALPLCLLAALGAENKLVPETRLDSGGEVTQVVLTPNGRSLLAVVNCGGSYELVAWDIPSKSKTVLAKATDSPLIMWPTCERNLLSPDGRSLLGFIGTKAGESFDLNAFIWDVSSRSKTALPTRKGKQFVSISGTFSTDGGVLAIPECTANVVRIWKRRRRGEMDRLSGLGWRAEDGRAWA